MTINPNMKLKNEIFSKIIPTLDNALDSLLESVVNLENQSFEIDEMIQYLQTTITAVINSKAALIKQLITVETEKE